MALNTTRENDPAVADGDVIVADREVYSCELGGGAALLDLRTSTYYSINPVGSEVWRLAGEPVTVEEIHRQLLEKFDVEPERCRQDLLALLDSFRAAGLIQVKHAQPA